MSNVLGNSAFIRGSGIDQSILDNYLPLSSGTLSGDLILYKNYPSILLDESNFGNRSMMTSGYHCVTVSVQNEVSDFNNRRQIILFDSSVNLVDSLVLDDVINGSSVGYYKIYGEHNVTAGTSDLTAASSPLVNGCIYQMYS